MKKQSTSKAPKNISVFLRVRPPVPRESKSTFENLIVDPREPSKVTINRKTGGKLSPKPYYFNKVFPSKISQKDVYEDFGRSAVDAAFDGQHGVLFVYGQTGSGKTFTVSNEDPNNLGVLQQGLKDAWGRMADDQDFDYECSVNYVQLYNEILTDLLDAQKGRVRIQLGPEGRGDIVLVSEASGLPIERTVRSYDETMDYFRTGMKRKEMTSTLMNNTSSRSHTVFNFNIRRSAKVKAMAVKDGESEQITTLALEGRLVICDLAGSERVSRTQAEGKTFDEATHINGSLLVLGKVVAALTEKNSQHAPFRESKLTRILQYSLMGNGNTSIVVNVSPADDSTEETTSAILFGQRAIQIKQEAKRHEVLDYKALYLQLLAELDSKNDGTLESALSEERAVYEERIAALEQKVQFLTEENELLRKENAGARGGKGGAANSTDSDWININKTLRNTINERDGRIKTVSDERIKLALLLAEEKRTVFRLAEKLRATMMRYQMDRQQWSQNTEDLGKELARAKGTDYISIGGTNNADDTPMTTPMSLQSPATKISGQGDEYMQEQLDKSYQHIRSLQQERQDLLIYQCKADKAIRLLYAEKEALSKKAPASK